MENQIQWILNKHVETNHFYGRYLPYEFHLRMVAKVVGDFSQLIELEEFSDVGINFPNSLEILMLAAYGHDLIEDTRTSYNECVKELGECCADIIYSVTNDKGRNRSERAGIEYYRLMRQTPGGVFIKLCDRIANIQYSKMTKSSMFNKYKKENKNFETYLGRRTNYKHLEPMFLYIDELLDIVKPEKQISKPFSVEV